MEPIKEESPQSTDTLKDAHAASAEALFNQLLIDTKANFGGLVDQLLSDGEAAEAKRIAHLKRIAALRARVAAIPELNAYNAGRYVANVISQSIDSGEDGAEVLNGDGLTIPEDIIGDEDRENYVAGFLEVFQERRDALEEEAHHCDHGADNYARYFELALQAFLKEGVKAPSHDECYWCQPQDSDPCLGEEPLIKAQQGNQDADVFFAELEARNDKNEDWCTDITDVLKGKVLEKSYGNGHTFTVDNYVMKDKLGKLAKEKCGSLHVFAINKLASKLEELGREDLIDAFSVCLYLHDRDVERWRDE